MSIKFDYKLYATYISYQDKLKAWTLILLKGTRYIIFSSWGTIFIQTNSLNDPCTVTAGFLKLFQLGLGVEISDEAYACL